MYETFQQEKVQISFRNISSEKNSRLLMETSRENVKKGFVTSFFLNFLFTYYWYTL